MIDDGPLGCLLELVWAPFRICQWMMGQSRVGTSEMDREAGRFWEGFAIVATVLIAVGALAAWWFFRG